MNITIEDELNLIKKKGGLGGIALPGAASGIVPAAQPTEAQEPAPAPEVAAPGPAGGPVLAPASRPEAAPAPTADTPPVNPLAAFINPPVENPIVGKFRPPEDDASSWDVMGAAWTRDTITGDVASFAERQRRNLVTDMVAALPPSRQQQIFAAMHPLEYGVNKIRFEQLVMDEAARYAAQNPTGWGDLPLTREQFDARLLNADQAALDEANAILAQPGGGIAEFTGAVARDFTRPANLALMPFGGTATSLLKFVATEAALSGVSSVAALPGQYAAAERLGLPDPNAVQQVAVDTAIGGAFAGVLGGIAKGLGWAYARTTGTRAAMPEGANPTEFEANVAAAEGLLTGNRTVQEETRDATAPGPLTLPPGNVPYKEAAVLRAIIGVESGGNARAQNPNSSARGLGQFIGSTWLTMIRKYRPDLAEGRSANEVLALRDDPNINAEMTAMYTRENYALLQSQGLPTNPGDLYLAHFMGPGGAASALRAPLNTPITSIMSRDAMAANAGIRFDGKRFADFTAGDLRRWAAHKMRSAYDPNASADMPTFTDSGTSRGYTGSGQINVGNEFRIDVNYEVVDYANLIRASGDLQPRDRSGANSDEQVAFIASRLDPALLMPSPNAATGAPIISPENIIESGNGRVMAIGRAYELHPDRAQAYRQMIIDQVGAIPEGITRPVLVARRTSAIADADIPRYGAATQNSGVAQMTPAEQARIMARNLRTGEMGRLDLTRPLSAPENQKFARGVMASLPPEVRNGYFDPKSDNLNAYGQRQLREALFARAWPDPDVMAAYIADDAGELKSLLDALTIAAPRWAALRIEIEAGRVAPEFDISPFVLDAVRMIVAARQVATRQSQTVTAALNDILDQPSILEGAISPLTTALVRKFWPGNRAAPADQVADFLGRYADGARASAQDQGMFAAPTPRDVLIGLDSATFSDLPENFGNPRGFALRNSTPPAARMADDAYTAGAASPEAEAAGAEIADSITPAARADQGLTMDGLIAGLRNAEEVARRSKKLSGSSKTASLRKQATDESAAYAELKKYRPNVSDDIADAMSPAEIAEFNRLDPIGKWANDIQDGRTVDDIIADPLFQEFADHIRLSRADQSLTTTPSNPALDDAAATLFDAQSAIIAARADTGDFDIVQADGTTIRASEMLDDMARDADTDFQITFCTTNEGAA